MKVDDVLQVGPLNRDGEWIGRVKDESDLELKAEIRIGLEENLESPGFDGL